MGQGGIRIWGSATVVIGVLVAAGGLLSKNIANSGGSVSQGGGTSINAGPGSSILVNPPSPAIPSPPTSQSSLPSSSPSSPPSPITPTEKKSKFECKDSGASVSNYTDLISVANKPEKPINRFYLTRSTSRSIVCNIIQNSGELKLTYGIPDNSSISRAVLRIYLDGKLHKSTDMWRGEKIRETINIENISGYKLEYFIAEINSMGDWVYRIAE